MGYNRAPAFVFLTLVLFAAANPMAHGQVATLTGLTVTGSLCCTSSGNCPGGPAISGVLVSLNCTNLLGAIVTLGEGTTDVKGGFNISVANVQSTLGSILAGNILPCAVVVKLPLSQAVCPVLSTATGILAGVPKLVGAVVSGATGLIGSFSVPVIIRLGVTL